MRLNTAVLLAFASAFASAEVLDSAANGFTVKTTLNIKAAPDEVYRKLVHDIGEWWNSAHTFSGDAHNLSIEDRLGGCFCEKLRVLARLDENKLDLTNKNVHRTDKDFAVAWVKTYGNGRVFYSTFGHREEVYDRPDIQAMYLEATKWVMKLTDADATPRPRP